MTTFLEDRIASPRRFVGGRRKRWFDVSAAFGLILVLSPLLLLCAGFVLLLTGRPIFIRHRRIGHGGREFPCLKFRTMVVEADRVLDDHLRAHPTARAEWEMSRKLKHDPRVTPLGRIFRKSSVDELPQLFNVLYGHMSLIGPRPIVAAEISRYGEAYDAYLRARPGLTGAWQVSGRSDTGYEDRIKLDLDYIGGWSMAKDIAILMRTVPAVARARGSY